MHPTDRYLATRNIPRMWCVWDMCATPVAVILVDNISSGRLAMAVKHALVEAYFAGANAN